MGKARIAMCVPTNNILLFPFFKTKTQIPPLVDQQTCNGVIMFDMKGHRIGVTTEQCRTVSE